MPYPVPPPELPPIVSTVTPAIVTEVTAPQANPLTVEIDAAASTAQLPEHSVIVDARPISVTQEAKSVAPPLASPSSPETFAVEPAANNFPNTEAALLGQPISLSLAESRSQGEWQGEDREITVLEFPELGSAKIQIGDRVFSSETAQQEVQLQDKPQSPELQPADEQQSPELQLENEPASSENEQQSPEHQQPESTPAPVSGVGGIIELTADRQQFDDQRQIFTAEGNVVMRFREAVLRADRLQVNLLNRLAVAEGNVSLTRGQQVLIGSRFDYNFVQGTGVVQQARGEIFVPSTGTDLDIQSDVNASAIPPRTVGDRILLNQPPTSVTPGGGGVTIGGGSGSLLPQPEGTVRRLRFEAERIDFTPEGWVAQNIRITNDPFSPPEVEVRAERATLTRVSPLRDEVRATRPRLVFDQRLSVPILRDRVVIDRTERDPAIARLGFDREDRGGLFVERSFEPISTRTTQLTVTPQFLVQKAVENGLGDLLSPSSFGLKARLNSQLSPTTQLRGTLTLNSLDFSEADDVARGSLRLTQGLGNHTLTAEYSYRDRLFNGSLGYQTVQSSLGAVIASPIYRLGNTGINLSYQAGAQYITANTDRLEYLDLFDTEELISLGRFQASATVSRNFNLWQGKGLPATPDAGLRYTPVPVVPYLQVVTAAIGTTSAYTNGDNQTALTGTIGLRGQFGHFSRPWLDYTGFSLLYSQVLQSGESPFKFDRVVDVRVLAAELTQQIYGPFRFGVRTVLNLDDGDTISTDFSLEYSRRTYGVNLRYNPVLGLASFNIRISDFNWTGGTEPFSGTDVRPVEGGVVQPNRD